MSNKVGSASVSILSSSISSNSSSTFIISNEEEKAASTNKQSSSLRITCYGSSSPNTPKEYITAAWSIGYILAKRGHICVNGAGRTGCMGAMNKGAMAGNGHIIGVIHEMFLVNDERRSNDWFEGWPSSSSSGEEEESSPLSSSPFLDNNNSNNKKEEDPSTSTTDCDIPIRELVIAGGDDLQERKRLLVERADALIVLPGGPGTWDELWEMACTRQHGISKQPIVCVNVNGFYNPFQEMLQQAYDEGLIEIPPNDIVQFEKTPEDAIRWIENEMMTKVPEGDDHQQRRQQEQEQRSHNPNTKQLSWWRWWWSNNNSTMTVGSYDISSLLPPVNKNVRHRMGMALITGVIIGITVGSSDCSPNDT